MKQTARIVVLIMCLILVCSCVVFADDTQAKTAETLEKFADKINDVYALLRSIALPLAAVCVAVSAFKMIFGGDKGVEFGKKGIIYTVLALFAIFLLPEVIHFASSIASSTAWKPH